MTSAAQATLPLAVVVLVSLGLAAGAVWAGLRLGRLTYLAEQSESGRAWTEYKARRDTPASGEGMEFYCRCGRREVVARSALAPTCSGVSCVGTEHEPRVMRPVEP